MLHMKEGTWLDSGAAVVVVVVTGQKLVRQAGRQAGWQAAQHAIVSLVPELVDPRLNVHIPRVCLFSLRFQRAGTFLFPSRFTTAIFEKEDICQRGKITLYWNNQLMF